MKTTRKIIALLMILSLLLTAVSSSMTVSAAKLGVIEDIPVLEMYTIHMGDSFDLSPYFRNEPTNNYKAASVDPDSSSVRIVSDAIGFTKEIAADIGRFGVNLLLINEYFSHDGFNDCMETYYIIVIVESDDITRADMDEIYSIRAIDVTMNYKSSEPVFYDFSSAGTSKAGLTCFARYVVVNSDDGKVFADKSGYVYGGKTGSYTGKLYVVDAMGHVFHDDFTVNVKYSFFQWLIMIFLFGWLWY